MYHFKQKIYGNRESTILSKKQIAIYYVLYNQIIMINLYVIISNIIVTT